MKILAASTRTAVLVAATLLALHARADDSRVEPMRKVHARFTGTPGTFAHFGESIKITMAFWT